MSDPHQLPRSGNVHPPRSSSISRDAHSHSTSANVNTATPRTSQGESLRRPAAHSDTIHQADHYNSTQQDAGNLMGNTNVYNPTLPLAEDLTGQIFGTINGFVAGGSFGNVYKCEWRRPSGPVEVAVKSFRYHTSEQDLRRFRREAAIWAHLVHDNIVTLYGTTEGFGPTTALVSPWFPDGTLHHLITEQGATLTIKSKLKLLHCIASGLYYLHSFPIVHGDITSFNVLVDLKGGEYKACLTDFGCSNVLCGHLKDKVVEGSTVRPGAVRWSAPELLRPHDHPSDLKPTTQNDMYSYGRIMFYLLTLVIPWHDIDVYQVVKKIQSGEDIQRPEISDATSHVTDARWNQIELCWSVDPAARPSAFMVMEFVKKELEAVKQDDVFVGGVQESHQTAYLVTEQITASVPPSPRVKSHIMPTRAFGSSSRTLVPSSPSQASFSTAPTHHLFSTVSTLSLTGPLNVLLFGETGVGKSSIINLITGRDSAQTSPDGATCTLTHTSYEVDLGTHDFKLWEVSSIESMGFFRSFFEKRRLKKAFKKLHRDEGVCLLLYCMRGSRAQRALPSDYKHFTDIVGSTAGPGRVPVAAVVTSLENYSTNMDDWWTKNRENLERLGMQFSSHACIMSLPDDPNAPSAVRTRRHRSEQAIRNLIYDSHRAGRTPGWARGVAFIPGTRLLVTCSYANSLLIWDLDKGEQVGEPLSGHHDRVLAVATSSDGRWIVSGALNGSILAWEVATNTSVPVSFKSHEKRVHSVVFAPDSETFASASDDETVCVWKRETGQIVLGPLLVDSEAYSVSYSPDGSRLAAGAEEHIIVWNSLNGEELLKIEQRARQIAFTQDGCRLVSGDYHNIRISDATTGHIIKEFAAHTSAIESLAIAPNGNKFATTSNDKTTRFFDLTTFEPIGEPLEHPDIVYCVAFSKDSQLVATGCDDKLIRTWAVPQSKSEQESQSALTQEAIPGLEDSEFPHGFFDYSDARSPPQRNNRTTSQHLPKGFRIKNIVNHLFSRSSVPRDRSPCPRRIPIVNVSATRGKYRTANAISGKRHLVQRPPRRRAHTSETGAGTSNAVGAATPATLQTTSTDACAVTSGPATPLDTGRVPEIGCLTILTRCFLRLFRTPQTGAPASRS